MYLLMDIGCIEDRAKSKIVGIFRDKGKAAKVAHELRKKHVLQKDGQHAFEVFLIPKDAGIAPEYLYALNLNEKE